MGLRLLTYALVLGAGFWSGVVHTIASRPIHPQITRPIATPLTQWKCDDQERREYTHACYKREQSSLIRQIQPKTRGKL